MHSRSDEPTSNRKWIDIHTHAIALDLPKPHDLWDQWPSVVRLSESTARIDLGGKPYRIIDERCWLPARRVSDMDLNNVDVQVISPIPATLNYDAPVSGAVAFAQAQNHFFAEFVQTAPARFRALGAVPLQDVAEAVNELTRCITELDFVGVEIGTHIGDVELADPTLDPFFDRAAELDALIFIHPIDSSVSARVAAANLTFGLGMPMETTIAASHLVTAQALERRRENRILLAHGGGTLPSIISRLDHSMMMTNPSSPSESLPSTRARTLMSDSLTYGKASLDSALSCFGDDHVMFGSDYPFPAVPRELESVVAGRSDDQRAAITYANAARLLNL